MKSIGVVGFGEFGRFVAGLVPGNTTVMIHEKTSIDRADIPKHYVLANLSELAVCDAVILAVPLDAYRGVLSELQLLLRPDTLIVDVCSVKTSSEKIFDDILGKHPEQLCLHPLFGPQSAAKSTTGFPLVVTREYGEKARQFVEFCEHYLHLSIERISAEEHDKQMALVHALTFFTARGLLRMHVHKVGLITPSFQKILDLAELEKHHSEELFQTIQKGNPYAADMRNKFITNLEALNAEINGF